MIREQRIRDGVIRYWAIRDVGTGDRRGSEDGEVKSI
jgi:hypothetical protein